MKRLSRALIALLALLPLLAAAGAAPRQLEIAPAAETRTPSTAEIAEGLEVVEQYADAVYKGDYATAFRLVRGIDDPARAAESFRDVMRNDVAAWAFRQLSTCQTNVEAMSSAIESYARDHEGAYPPSLSALVSLKDLYLTELPRCPAGGIYQYRHTASGFSVACHENAHVLVGIKGSFPAYASGSGLSLGGQKINLSTTPQFTVKSHHVAVDAWLPDFHILTVRLEEDSGVALIDNLMKRSSIFALTRKDGRWKIDLYLSNRDMTFVYDFEKWRKTEALPKQILVFYQISTSPVRFVQEYQQSGQLELEVCESNLRSISLAVEAWSVDHGGAYPPGPGFAAIVPRYLKRLPVCPSGGQYAYERDPRSGSYTIRCMGHAHANAGLPANHPLIDPINGVTER
jgi:hypothetical protein